MTAQRNPLHNVDSWRLRVYPVALIGTLIGVLLLATVLFDRDDPTSRLGGDYPAFYAAGSIAAAGDWAELYSAARQQTEQAGLIDDEGGYLYFSYPPFVAAAYAALVGLGYQWSYLVHTILMGLALLGAIGLLWPWLEDLRWPAVALFAVALGFYPLLRSVAGGQNTVLSLILLAAAARCDRDTRPVLAGLALALLLFKPQFGVVLVPLMVIGRRWRMLAGWTAGAASLFGISTLLMGGAWIEDWWDQASSFRDSNVAANGVNFVSFPGFIENLAGPDSSLVFVLGYGTAAVVGVGVAYYWWRHRDTHPLERFALAAAAVVVAAPQTLYYDVGLMLLGSIAAIAYLRPRIIWWVAVGFAVSWTQLLSGPLGWSPLGPLAWAAVVLLLWRLVAGSAREPTPV